jgi:hypothetical protein
MFDGDEPVGMEHLWSRTVASEATDGKRNSHGSG